MTGCPKAPASCEPLVKENADVKEGISFGGNESEIKGRVRFDGGTPDLAHVVLSTQATELTESASPSALYEWSAGAPPAERLQPVSVLPGGAIVSGNLGLADETGATSLNARHAISADGSRVFWSEPQGALYLRQLSPGTPRTLPIGSGFEDASADGSRVFFNGQVCEVKANEASGELECPIVAKDGQLLGASEDGSYVYFMSEEALTGNENAQHEKALAGSPNAYLIHYDAATRSWQPPVLVAVLSGADATDWSSSKLPGDLSQRTARVSPDGHWLAFSSARSLTGYDNVDQNEETGSHHDEEVFLYHADTGALACASCDPTGARPTGAEYARLGNGGLSLAGGSEVWPKSTWLAADVPGWSEIELDTARYQSRYLSDAGRLFFNTPVALVPADVNHNWDVYEYEPAGVGGCSSSATSAGVVFRPAPGGCVGLISSGVASGESGFLDASETGGDVFFQTAEQLVPQDIDTAHDVYDAHVCTTESPCSAQVAAPPACVTADACRAAPTPQPEVFGAPSSATFSGPGNLAPPPPPKPKTAAQIRAEKLTKALKQCHKDKQRKKRTVCEKSAHKRYGPLKAKKASNNRRPGR